MSAPGRKMRAALAYVAAHPGCSKSDAVRELSGPVIRLEPADRLIRRGLVRAEFDEESKSYRLYVTGKGTAARGPG